MRSTEFIMLAKYLSASLYKYKRAAVLLRNYTFLIRGSLRKARKDNIGLVQNKPLVPDVPKAPDKSHKSN